MSEEQQVERLDAWWDSLDDDGRRRAVELDPHGALPADMASHMRETGVSMVLLGSPGVYQQTDSIRRYLQSKREQAHEG